MIHTYSFNHFYKNLTSNKNKYLNLLEIFDNIVILVDYFYCYSLFQMISSSKLLQN